MTEVEVPFGGNSMDNAVLLLAAAEELELDASVVKTTEGAFLVPQEVYDQAFNREQEPDEPETKAPTKKAAKKKVD